MDRNDRFDSESMAFHRSVREGFLERAKLYPGRFRVIDAGGTVSEVAAAVRKAINDEYGLELL